MSYWYGAFSFSKISRNAAKEEKYMKLTLFLKEDVAEGLRQQFGHVTNPIVVNGVKQVYLKDGYLHSVIHDDCMWRMSDIEKFSVEI